MRLSEKRWKGKGWKVEDEKKRCTFFIGPQMDLSLLFPSHLFFSLPTSFHKVHFPKLEKSYLTR